VTVNAELEFKIQQTFDWLVNHSLKPARRNNLLFTTNTEIKLRQLVWALG